jgi:hypothetical protein
MYVARSDSVAAPQQQGGRHEPRPVHRHEPDTSRVQHTIGGISEALRGSRRAQFFAELLRARSPIRFPEDLNH